MSDAHLSSLAFDQLLADEPSEEAQAHLKTCDVCRKKLEALQHERAAFLEGSHVEAQVDAIFAGAQNVKTGPWIRARWLWAAAPLVAAAVALFVIKKPVDQVQLKGGHALTIVYAQTGEVILEQPISPGARLAFEVSCPEPCQVVLLGRDPGGQLYSLHPEDRALSAGSAAKRLGIQAALDEAKGDETLLAFFCVEAMRPTLVLKAFQANGRAPEKCVLQKRTLRRKTQ